jgi:hypothetical protein
LQTLAAWRAGKRTFDPDNAIWRPDAELPRPNLGRVAARGDNEGRQAIFWMNGVCKLLAASVVSKDVSSQCVETKKVRHAFARYKCAPVFLRSAILWDFYSSQWGVKTDETWQFATDKLVASVRRHQREGGYLEMCHPAFERSVFKHWPRCALNSCARSKGNDDKRGDKAHASLLWDQEG